MQMQPIMYMQIIYIYNNRLKSYQTWNGLRVNDAATAGLLEPSVEFSKGMWTAHPDLWFSKETREWSEDDGGGHEHSASEQFADKV